MKYWWKSLALQTLPWCFHMSMPKQTTSPSSHEQQPQEAAVVRLVGSDGKVRVYRRPVTASELMQEHPCHLVCRSDAFLIGQKIPAVAPGEQLQPGQAYFLLPAHLFHSVLSFVSLASSLLLLLHDKSKGGEAAKAAAAVRPFEIQKTASGTLQIRVCDEFLIDGSIKEEEDEATKKSVLCSDERLEKEYEELVRYSKSRRWKPMLETITEDDAAAGDSRRRRRSRGSSSGSRGRGLPLLGRLGSRRKGHPFMSCAHGNGNGNGNAVSCST